MISVARAPVVTARPTKGRQATRVVCKASTEATLRSAIGAAALTATLFASQVMGVQAASGPGGLGIENPLESAGRAIKQNLPDLPSVPTPDVSGGLKRANQGARDLQQAVSNPRGGPGGGQQNVEYLQGKESAKAPLGTPARDIARGPGVSAASKFI